MPMTKGLRKNIRMEVFSGPNQQTLITNYTVNISIGGVYLETDTISPVDTLLVMKFKIPGNNPIISCNARVAWTNEAGQPKKPNLPPGMGIQFLNLSLGKLQFIRNFLKEGDLKPDW